MLDFYAIPDSYNVDKKTEFDKRYLEVLQPRDFLGGLTMKEHRILWRIWECCEPHQIEIPFWDDHYLNSDQVKIMYACCQEHYEAAREETGVQDPPLYRKLLDMLEPAVEANHGIVTICD